mgnify:CR=1 FL=1
MGYTVAQASFYIMLMTASQLAGVLIGGALVFASSVSYALYLSGSASMIGRLGAMRFSALAMLMSSAVTPAPSLTSM